MQTDPMQWRIVFFLTAAFYFFGNLLFIIFGRTTPRVWNSPIRSNSRSPLRSRNLEAERGAGSETEPLYNPNSS